MVPMSEKSVVQVHHCLQGAALSTPAYCISLLSCLLLPHHNSAHTPATSNSFSSLSPRCSVMPLHLAHSPSAYSALSSLLCLANFHTLFKVPLKCPQVPPFLSHNPWSTHPLKHIALCQVCLSSISPAVLNRK